LRSIRARLWMALFLEKESTCLSDSELRER
jgi:hypothetical protein